MVSDTAQAKNDELAKRNLHHQGSETFLPIQRIRAAQINALCEYPAPTFDVKLQGANYANTFKILGGRLDLPLCSSCFRYLENRLDLSIFLLTL